MRTSPVYFTRDPSTGYLSPIAVISMGTLAIKTMLDPVSAQDAATKNYVDVTIAALPKPLTFKGTINLAADFPTAAAVQAGWTYQIGTDVTDNNPAKTNTGLSFTAGDEIA